MVLESLNNQDVLQHDGIKTQRSLFLIGINTTVKIDYFFHIKYFENRNILLIF